MKKSVRKLFSLLTLIFFSTSQAAQAAPVQAPAPFINEIIPAAAFDLDLPPDLGTIEYLNSGSGPALVHIQTAHGNLDAQKKIQAILHHLHDQYGIRHVFIEGSAYKLRPELLRLFPDDMPLTMQIADELTKKALVKGEELFLLETLDAQGHGIENAASYRANGEAFKAVLIDQEKTSSFLNDMNMQIERLTSPYLNKDLRAFLSRLDNFEAKTLPMPEWLAFLKGEASRRLDMDLSDAAWQLDWPMLVRLFKLGELEKQLDTAAFAKERGQFLKAIRRVPAPVRERVEHLLSSPVSRHQLADPETGLLFEKMAGALPANFNYKAYPNVSRFIGHLILQSEIKGALLMGEMDKLTDKIAGRLAETPEEKKVLELLKDYRLLKKLFAIELVPADYEKIQARSAEMRPEAMIARFKTLNGSRRVKNVRFDHLKDINDLYEKALEFYRTTKERDSGMTENLAARMQEMNIEKAAVITGGFHAEPFREHFESLDYNYALVSPKISDTTGRDEYLESVLHRIPTIFTEATRNTAPFYMQGVQELQGLGLNKQDFVSSMGSAAEAATQAFADLGKLSQIAQVNETLFSGEYGLQAGFEGQGGKPEIKWSLLPMPGSLVTEPLVVTVPTQIKRVVVTRETLAPNFAAAQSVRQRVSGGRSEVRNDTNKSKQAKIQANNTKIADLKSQQETYGNEPWIFQTLYPTVAKNRQANRENFVQEAQQKIDRLARKNAQLSDDSKRSEVRQVEVQIEIEPQLLGWWDVKSILAKNVQTIQGKNVVDPAQPIVVSGYIGDMGKRGVLTSINRETNPDVLNWFIFQSPLSVIYRARSEVRMKQKNSTEWQDELMGYFRYLKAIADGPLVDEAKRVIGDEANERRLRSAMAKPELIDQAKAIAARYDKADIFTDKYLNAADSQSLLTFLTGAWTVDNPSPRSEVRKVVESKKIKLAKEAFLTVSITKDNGTYEVSINGQRTKTYRDREIEAALDQVVDLRNTVKGISRTVASGLGKDSAYALYERLLPELDQRRTKQAWNNDNFVSQNIDTFIEWAVESARSEVRVLKLPDGREIDLSQTGFNKELIAQLLDLRALSVYGGAPYKQAQIDIYLENVIAASRSQVEELARDLRFINRPAADTLEELLSYRPLVRTRGKTLEDEIRDLSAAFTAQGAKTIRTPFYNMGEVGVFLNQEGGNVYLKALLEFLEKLDPVKNKGEGFKYRVDAVTNKEVYVVMTGLTDYNSFKAEEIERQNRREAESWPRIKPLFALYQLARLLDRNGWLVQGFDKPTGIDGFDKDALLLSLDQYLLRRVNVSDKKRIARDIISDRSNRLLQNTAPAQTHLLTQADHDELLRLAADAGIDLSDTAVSRLPKARSEVRGSSYFEPGYEEPRPGDRIYRDYRRQAAELISYTQYRGIRIIFANRNPRPEGNERQPVFLVYNPAETKAWNEKALADLPAVTGVKDDILTRVTDQQWWQGTPQELIEYFADLSLFEELVQLVPQSAIDKQYESHARHVFERRGSTPAILNRLIGRSEVRSAVTAEAAPEGLVIKKDGISVHVVPAALFKFDSSRITQDNVSEVIGKFNALSVSLDEGIKAAGLQDHVSTAHSSTTHTVLLTQVDGEGYRNVAHTPEAVAQRLQQLFDNVAAHDYYTIEVGKTERHGNNEIAVHEVTGKYATLSAKMYNGPDGGLSAHWGQEPRSEGQGYVRGVKLLKVDKTGVTFKANRARSEVRAAAKLPDVKPEPLTWEAWWATMGSWGDVKKAIAGRPYEYEKGGLRQHANWLINRIVANEPKNNKLIAKMFAGGFLKYAVTRLSDSDFSKLIALTEAYRAAGADNIYELASTYVYRMNAIADSGIFYSSVRAFLVLLETGLGRPDARKEIQLLNTDMHTFQFLPVSGLVPVRVPEADKKNFETALAGALSIAALIYRKTSSPFDALRMVLPGMTVSSYGTFIPYASFAQKEALAADFMIWSSERMADNQYSRRSVWVGLSALDKATNPAGFKTVLDWLKTNRPADIKIEPLIYAKILPLLAKKKIPAPTWSEYLKHYFANEKEFYLGASSEAGSTVLEFALERSATPDEFLQILNLVRQRAGGDLKKYAAALTHGFGYANGLPAAIVPEDAIELVFALAETLNLDMVQVGAVKFNALFNASAEYRKKRQKYKVVVDPELGEYRDEEYTYDDPYTGSQSGTQSVYYVTSEWGLHLEPAVVRAPSALAVAASKAAAPTPALAPNFGLSSDYLVNQGLLTAAVESYGKNSIGKYIPGYIPFESGGKNFYLRVYPRGKTNLVVPAAKIFLRGDFETDWSFEVIDAEDYARMISADGLENWSLRLNFSDVAPNLAKNKVSDSDTLRRLQTRNWNWAQVSEPGWELDVAKVADRISAAKKSANFIIESLERDLGIQNLASVYVVGGYLWALNPQDIDIIVVTNDDGRLETFEPFDAFLKHPVHVRAVGISSLNRAVAGTPVENFHRLRKEALILYGGAVLIAGEDIFGANQPPQANFGPLAAHFEAAKANISNDPANATKIKRWDLEIAAIKKYAPKRSEVRGITQGDRIKIEGSPALVVAARETDFDYILIPDYDKVLRQEDAIRENDRVTKAPVATTEYKGLNIELIAPRIDARFPFNPGDKVEVKIADQWFKGTLLYAGAGQYHVVTYEPIRKDANPFMSRSAAMRYSAATNGLMRHVGFDASGMYRSEVRTEKKNLFLRVWKNASRPLSTESSISEMTSIAASRILTLAFAALVFTVPALMTLGIVKIMGISRENFAGQGLAAIASIGIVSLGAYALAKYSRSEVRAEGSAVVEREFEHNGKMIPAVIKVDIGRGKTEGLSLSHVADEAGKELTLAYQITPDASSLQVKLLASLQGLRSSAPVIFTIDRESREIKNILPIQRARDFESFANFDVDEWLLFKTGTPWTKAAIEAARSEVRTSPALNLAVGEQKSQWGWNFELEAALDGRVVLSYMANSRNDDESAQNYPVSVPVVYTDLPHAFSLSSEATGASINLVLIRVYPNKAAIFEIRQDTADEPTFNFEEDMRSEIRSQDALSTHDVRNAVVMIAAAAIVAVAIVGSAMVMRWVADRIVDSPAGVSGHVAQPDKREKPATTAVENPNAPRSEVRSLLAFGFEAIQKWVTDHPYLSIGAGISAAFFATLLAIAYVVDLIDRMQEGYAYPGNPWHMAKLMKKISPAPNASLRGRHESYLKEFAQRGGSRFSDFNNQPAKYLQIISGIKAAGLDYAIDYKPAVAGETVYEERDPREDENYFAYGMYPPEPRQYTVGGEPAVEHILPKLPVSAAEEMLFITPEFQGMIDPFFEMIYGSPDFIDKTIEQAAKSLDSFLPGEPVLTDETQIGRRNSMRAIYALMVLYIRREGKESTVTNKKMEAIYEAAVRILGKDSARYDSILPERFQSARSEVRGVTFQDIFNAGYAMNDSGAGHQIIFPEKDWDFRVESGGTAYGGKVKIWNVYIPDSRITPEEALRNILNDTVLPEEVKTNFRNLTNRSEARSEVRSFAIDEMPRFVDEALESMANNPAVSSAKKEKIAITYKGETILFTYVQNGAEIAPTVPSKLTFGQTVQALMQRKEGGFALTARFIVTQHVKKRTLELRKVEAPASAVRSESADTLLQEFEDAALETPDFKPVRIVEKGEDLQLVDTVPDKNIDKLPNGDVLRQLSQTLTNVLSQDANFIALMLLNSMEDLQQPERIKWIAVDPNDADLPGAVKTFLDLIENTHGRRGFFDLHAGYFTLKAGRPEVLARLGGKNSGRALIIVHSDSTGGTEFPGPGRGGPAVPRPTVPSDREAGAALDIPIHPDDLPTSGVGESLTESGYPSRRARRESQRSELRVSLSNVLPKDAPKGALSIRVDKATHYAANLTDLLALLRFYGANPKTRLGNDSVLVHLPDGAITTATLENRFALSVTLKKLTGSAEVEIASAKPNTLPTWRVQANENTHFIYTIEDLAALFRFYGVEVLRKIDEENLIASKTVHQDKPQGGGVQVNLYDARTILGILQLMDARSEVRTMQELKDAGQLTLVPGDGLQERVVARLETLAENAKEMRTTQVRPGLLKMAELAQAAAVLVKASFVNNQLVWQTLFQESGINPNQPQLEQVRRLEGVLRTMKTLLEARSEVRATAVEIEKGVQYFKGKIATDPIRAKFRPSRRADLKYVPELSDEQKARYRSIALGSLAAGEGIFGNASAGAAARMAVSAAPEDVKAMAAEVHGEGHELHSKAAVPVGRYNGRVYTYLGLMLTNIALLEQQIRALAPGSKSNDILIMTNESYQEELTRELERQNFYGLSPDQFMRHEGRLGFQQDLGVKYYLNQGDVKKVLEGVLKNAKDAAERAELEVKYKPAYERALAKAAELEKAIADGRTNEVVHATERDPLGHGEFFHQLVSKGILLDIIDKNKKWISFRNIDNTAATFDDDWLITLGIFLEENINMQPEVSLRIKGQKGGGLIITQDQNHQLTEDPSFEATFKAFLKDQADAGAVRLFENGKIPAGVEAELETEAVVSGNGAVVLEPSRMTYETEEIRDKAVLKELIEKNQIAVFRGKDGRLHAYRIITSMDTAGFNDAVAIFNSEYVIDIYRRPEQSREEFIDELRAAKAAGTLEEIAERGRAKFPKLVDPKPSRDLDAFGLVKLETNMWQSTSAVAETSKVRAVAVEGIAGIDRGAYAQLRAAEQDAIMAHVRMLATKQWNGPVESYESNAVFIEAIMRGVFEQPLFPQDAQFTGRSEVRTAVLTEQVPAEDLKHAINTGTAGWRATTATGISIGNMRRLAKAVASVYKEDYPDGKYPLLAVGYDARPNGREYAQAMVEVLAAYGIPVEFIDRVTPTPLNIEVTRTTLPAGERRGLALHVTASHNPVVDKNGEEYSGVKFLTGGVPADDSYTKRITTYANDTALNAEYQRIPLQDIPADLVTIPQDPILPSLNRLNSSFNFPDLKARLAQLKQQRPDFGVVLSTSHGASGEIATRALQSLDVLADEDIYDFKGIRALLEAGQLPLFVNDPKGNSVPWGPDPTKRHFLSPEVTQPHPGKLTFLIDGDGDRLVVIDMDGKTEIDPNQLGMILYHYLRSHGLAAGPVVRTVPTTRGLDKLAQIFGDPVIATGVGSKNFGPHVDQLSVGVEESGHIFFRRGNEVFVDNAVAIAMQVLDIVAAKGISLSEYLDEIWAEITAKTGQERLVHFKTEVTPALVNDELKAFVLELRNNPQLAHDFESRVAKKLGKQPTFVINTTDTMGFALEFSDGWAMPRNSGTEPVIRIYDELPVSQDRTAAAKVVEETLIEMAAIHSPKSEIRTPTEKPEPPIVKVIEQILATTQVDETQQTRGQDLGEQRRRVPLYYAVMNEAEDLALLRGEITSVDRTTRLPQTPPSSGARRASTPLTQAIEPAAAEDQSAPQAAPQREVTPQYIGGPINTGFTLGGISKLPKINGIEGLENTELIEIEAAYGYPKELIGQLPVAVQRRLPEHPWQGNETGPSLLALRDLGTGAEEILAFTVPYIPFDYPGRRLSREQLTQIVSRSTAQNGLSAGLEVELPSAVRVTVSPNQGGIVDKWAPTAYLGIVVPVPSVITAAQNLSRNLSIPEALAPQVTAEIDGVSIELIEALNTFLISGSLTARVNVDETLDLVDRLEVTIRTLGRARGFNRENTLKRITRIRTELQPLSLNRQITSQSLERRVLETAMQSARFNYGSQNVPNLEPEIEFGILSSEEAQPAPKPAKLFITGRLFTVRVPVTIPNPLATPKAGPGVPKTILVSALYQFVVLNGDSRPVEQLAKSEAPKGDKIISSANINNRNIYAILAADSPVTAEAAQALLAKVAKLVEDQDGVQTVPDAAGIAATNDLLNLPVNSVAVPVIQAKDSEKALVGLKVYPFTVNAAGEPVLAPAALEPGPRSEVRTALPITKVKPGNEIVFAENDEPVSVTQNPNQLLLKLELLDYPVIKGVSGITNLRLKRTPATARLLDLLGLETDGIADLIVSLDSGALTPLGIVTDRQIVTFETTPDFKLKSQRPTIISSIPKVSESLGIFKISSLPALPVKTVVGEGENDRRVGILFNSTLSPKLQSVVQDINLRLQSGLLNSAFETALASVQLGKLFLAEQSLDANQPTVGERKNAAYLRNALLKDRGEQFTFAAEALQRLVLPELANIHARLREEEVTNLTYGFPPSDELLEGLDKALRQGDSRAAQDLLAVVIGNLDLRVSRSTSKELLTKIQVVNDQLLALLEVVAGRSRTEVRLALNNLEPIAPAEDLTASLPELDQQASAAGLLTAPQQRVFENFRFGLLPLTVLLRLIEGGIAAAVTILTAVLERKVYAEAVTGTSESILIPAFGPGKFVLGEGLRNNVINKKVTVRANVPTAQAGPGQGLIKFDLLNLFLTKNQRALALVLQGFEERRVATNSSNPLLMTVLPAGKSEADVKRAITQAMQSQSAGITDRNEQIQLANAITFVPLAAGQDESSAIAKIIEDRQYAVAVMGEEVAAVVGAAVFEIGDLNARDLPAISAALIQASSIAEGISGIPEPEIRAVKLSEDVSKRLPGFKPIGGRFVLTFFASLVQFLKAQNYIDTRA